MKKKTVSQNKYPMIIGFVVVVLVVGFLVFNNNNQAGKQTENVNSPAEIKVDTESGPNAKIFSPEELSKYDGENGNPPYVAVDGIVYDMTGVFNNGSHYGHFAGKELTSAFYMQHVKSHITKYPAVGTLE